MDITNPPTEAHHPPRQLRLHAFLPRTRVLGPGERFALWVQGCPRRCLGCVAQGMLERDGGRLVAVAELAARIVAEQGIEGLTLSGGEPFAQAEALAELVAAVRRERDLGVIAYTGFTLADLRAAGAREPGVTALLGQVDLLIDGPYRAAEDDGLSLRGSANQAVYALTGRYAGEVERCYGRYGRAVELHMAADGLLLAGVPGAAARRAWRRRFVAAVSCPPGEEG